MQIGVFDTGSGGKFVTEKLQLLFPDISFTVINDQEYAPYGDRSTEEIIKLTDQAIQPILNTDIIILACNTATTAAINTLRDRYPVKPFIGIEPMIKPACQNTKTDHITLLATKATNSSSRTKLLIKQHAKDTRIDKINTTNWAKLIDNNLADTIDLSAVGKSVATGSDSIIIGCTHYIALIPKLKTLFPETTIYEPTDAISRRISEIASSRS